MANIDIAIIIVIVYPVAFIIVYGLSCIAHRELKAEKKLSMARKALMVILYSDGEDAMRKQAESAISDTL